VTTTDLSLLLHDWRSVSEIFLLVLLAESCGSMSIVEALDGGH
jgi:hypothetical protein